ncbi:MAG: nitroreductase family protein [Ruminococcaceae bacterium]|nr:nitroreductase family protein [Oscillospiraceae bacterium]
MDLESLVLQNRSYRSFDETQPVSKDILRKLVDLARRCPSGMNKQPLCYKLLTEEADISKMLRNCRFAASLGIPLPPAGHCPTAFILIFEDTAAQSPRTLMLKDVGIAAQTILLGAVEMGFGGCMLGSFDPARLNADFGIADRYQPQLAIALGKPAEEVALTEPHGNGSLTYYRENGTHYVPKRCLEDILL